MQFRSPSGEPIKVSNVFGHSAVVTMRCRLSRIAWGSSFPEA